MVFSRTCRESQTRLSKKPRSKNEPSGALPGSPLALCVHIQCLYANVKHTAHQI